MEDNTVFSIQWTDLPPGLSGGLTAALLLDWYLEEMQRMTGQIIRPLSGRDGVSFRLFGVLPLLSFLPPAAEGYGVALRICGGLLVQRDQCDRGELLFECIPLPDGGSRISLRLSDYCPLLLGSQRPSAVRRWLYRLTQAALHRLVTIRFLKRVYRRLGGGVCTVEAVAVQVREGRHT